MFGWLTRLFAGNPSEPPAPTAGEGRQRSLEKPGRCLDRGNVARGRRPNNEISMGSSRSATAVDSHVGRRVCERRVALGLTASQFAEIIGVTYQQALKYERGADRLSAGRLYEIACALGAPITYFLGIIPLTTVPFLKRRLSPA